MRYLGTEVSWEMSEQLKVEMMLGREQQEEFQDVFKETPGEA